MLQLVCSGGILGYDGSLGTCSYGTVLCQEACIASHDFDEEDAFVAGGCVAYLIYALHDGVEGGIIAYGEVRAVEVVVYGAWKTYAGYVKFLREDARSSQ